MDLINEYTEFENSKFKWFFILRKWLWPAWMDLYKNKEVLYYLASFLWLIFIFSKVFPNNHNIIIDHINLLNIINIMLIFLFLMVIWIVVWIFIILIADIIIIIFLFILKIIIKWINSIFKTKLSIFSIKSEKKFIIYQIINSICCIIPMIILVIWFSFQNSTDNTVYVKTTFQEKSFTGILDYYSWDNYIFRWKNWYIVIPKDKIEYIVYPKIIFQ